MAVTAKWYGQAIMQALGSGTAGETTTIEIPATVNDLVAAGHYETRVVHLTANYAGGRVHNSEYRYQVANLL